MRHYSFTVSDDLGAKFDDLIKKSGKKQYVFFEDLITNLTNNATKSSGSADKERPTAAIAEEKRNEIVQQ